MTDLKAKEVKTLFSAKITQEDREMIRFVQDILGEKTTISTIRRLFKIFIKIHKLKLTPVKNAVQNKY